MTRRRAGDFEIAVEHLPLSAVMLCPRNARKHPKQQLERLSAAIREFGFNVPVLIDEGGRLIAGHARLDAAKALEIERIPCVRLTHLTEAQKQALAISDNRIPELATWDPEILAQELAALSALELDFPIEITGFETAEIDVLLNAGDGNGLDPENQAVEVDRGRPTVSGPGDCWILGQHRLLCGNARDPASFERLLGADRAQVMFADPPYNVAIQGHVSGLGQVKHRDSCFGNSAITHRSCPHQCSYTTGISPMLC